MVCFCKWVRYYPLFQERPHSNSFIPCNKVKFEFGPLIYNLILVAKSSLCLLHTDFLTLMRRNSMTNGLLTFLFHVRDPWKVILEGLPVWNLNFPPFSPSHKKFRESLRRRHFDSFHWPDKKWFITAPKTTPAWPCPRPPRLTTIASGGSQRRCEWILSKIWTWRSKTACPPGPDSSSCRVLFTPGTEGAFTLLWRQCQSQGGANPCRNPPRNREIG